MKRASCEALLDRTSVFSFIFQSSRRQFLAIGPQTQNICGLIAVPRGHCIQHKPQCPDPLTVDSALVSFTSFATRLINECLPPRPVQAHALFSSPPSTS